MPLQAFLSLPSDKRSAIEKAAFFAFSKLPYEKVSIFQIAKAAGISRASVYCYFEDKEDLYFYLVDGFMSKFCKVNCSNNTSIFTFAEQVFEQCAGYKDTPMQSFFEQLLENMKPSVQNTLKNSIKFKSSKPSTWFSFEETNLKTKEDIKIFEFMVMNSLTFHLMRYYKTSRTKEHCKRQFIKSLEILKHGVLKGEIND